MDKYLDSIYIYNSNYNKLFIYIKGISKKELEHLKNIIIMTINDVGIVINNNYIIEYNFYKYVKNKKSKYNDEDFNLYDYKKFKKNYKYKKLLEKNLLMINKIEKEL